MSKNKKKYKKSNKESNYNAKDSYNERKKVYRQKNKQHLFTENKINKKEFKLNPYAKEFIYKYKEGLNSCMNPYTKSLFHNKIKN